MLTQLDNIMWNALSGTQARFAAGSGGARRYAKGFSGIVGFADTERPDFAALTPECDVGEPLYCDRWRGPPPAGWRIEAETTMFKMVWRGPPPPDEAPEALPLGPEHLAQVLELVALTKPGPFGPRTIELGDYFGLFEHGPGRASNGGGRLIAMAGERMQCGMLREISGVCTHPDFQGRGLARRLMTRLVARQAARGETSFLHVLAGNAGARALYARMGFHEHMETVARVIARV